MGQGILKNIKKFNNIKLAKGIDLQFFVTENRPKYEQIVGISTETYGDKWFITPKGRAIFKTYDAYYGDNIRNIRIINELVCKELCDQIDLDCAEYELAEINGINGLLSYDISQGKKLVSFSKFMKVSKRLDPNVMDFSQAIDLYVNRGYKINKTELIISMYKTILFDTLTLQTDRNANNFNLLYNKKNNEFTPAKLIDNEFAFCGELLQFWTTYDNIENCDLEYILHEYNMNSRIITFDGCYCANSKHLKNNIKYLVLYAKKYPSLSKILKNTLNSININLAFKNVEKNKIRINSNYKKYAGTLVENIKQMILKEYATKISKDELFEAENIL